MNLLSYLTTGVKALFIFLPWPVKRSLLQRMFGYTLAPNAFIGLAWIYPRKLCMKERSRIDSFTVAVNLDLLQLGKCATIGRNNWITGFPSATKSNHFSHQPSRSSALVLEAHSAITKNHHIDATNRILIGSFTTIAGYYSQFLTHSVDFYNCRQHSSPIIIGSYCFVGTNSVILGGSILPDNSILGAFSLLNKPLTQEWCLYAGHPAKYIKPIDRSSAYFSRTDGFID